MLNAHFKFLYNSTAKMEDSSLSLAYQPSFAGGKSGLSFGIFQNDVAKNLPARTEFEEILTSSGLFADGEIEDLISRAAKSGATSSDFTTSEITKITSALSSPSGRAKVDAVDLTHFNTMLKPWIEQANTAGTSNPDGQGVFNQTHSEYLKAHTMIAAWVNRTGAPNTLSRYLRGEAVTANGKSLQIVGEPTLADITNYLKEQKQFRPVSEGGNGENFANWETRIDAAVTHGRVVTSGLGGGTIISGAGTTMPGPPGGANSDESSWEPAVREAAAAAASPRQHYYLHCQGLPENSLAFISMDCDNLSLSSDYQMTIKATGKVDSAAIFEKNMQLKTPYKGDYRYWHGVVTAISEDGFTHDGSTIFTLTLQSPLSALKLTAQNRVFREQSVIAVVNEVLSSAGFLPQQISLADEGKPLPFIVQYDESDYDFICRILFHHGYFFTIEQNKEDWLLIITDDIDQLSARFDTISLPYISNSGQVRSSDSIFNLSESHQLRTDSVTLNDYHYDQSPHLLTQSQNKTDISGAGEHYRFGDNYQDKQTGDRLATYRQQAIDWQRQILTIDTDCKGLHPGMLLTITSSPLAINQWRVIAISQRGNESAKLNFGDFVGGLTYHAQVTLIPTSAAYRTPVARPEKVHDMLRCSVAKSLDEQGRYEIQMPFDDDNKASPALRLVQPYAGEHHGMHFPYSEGSEVIVTFENGDIDRPVIMGALFNDETPSPVTTQNLTENQLTTRSANKLVMDDKQREIQVKLATAVDKNRLLLDASEAANQAELTSEGNISVEAGKNIHLQTDSNQTALVGEEQTTWVNEDAQLMTQEGHINFQSAGAINLSSVDEMQLETVSSNFNLRADKAINLTAQESMTMRSEQGAHEFISEQGNVNLNASGDINMAARENLNLATKNGLFSVDNSGNVSIAMKNITINAPEITIKAKSIGENSQE